MKLHLEGRRFGKTLNMSMLRYFFEQGKTDNAELFRGLKIMDAGEEYLAHMGKYPVISISLKSMKQYSYELSYEMLTKAIEGEYTRHWPEIEKSRKLTDVKIERYIRIRDEKMAEILSENLMDTISFYDYQESYYHGFLVGMLKNIGNYIVQSNRESGNGRPDILVRYPSVRGKTVIIEIKITKTYQGLEEKCEEALQQIEEQKYEAALRQEGYQKILKYGVAFYKKECMVKMGE